MAKDTPQKDYESLGELLRKTRVSQGLEFEDIKQETRISTSNLRAMEADDFDNLPADAFAKGFYALYAKTLNLDPDEIVASFFAAIGKTPPSHEDSWEHIPASEMEAKVSKMAEPSMFSPLSTLGFVLLLLIILGGGICWYLDINPATYISEKIRGVSASQTAGPHSLSSS